ncbi:peptide deformylase [Patescibacteria group bacterium]
MKILKYPNEILKKEAKKVKDPQSEETQNLIKEMVQTMRSNNGLGLAAPQVGVSLKLCVIEEGGILYTLINPKITKTSKETSSAEEGCLSFPGKFIQIERSEKVTVLYLNEKGERCKIKTSGLLARALQHEIDHLNGILFINRAK